MGGGGGLASVECRVFPPVVSVPSTVSGGCQCAAGERSCTSRRVT